MPAGPAEAPTNAFAHKKGDNYVIVWVAAVCILILLISYSRTLKRICCERNGARLSRGPVSMRNLNDPVFQDVSLQFHSHGLESAIMHSLPISQYKGNEQGSKPGNNECAVCLGEFQEGEWLKHLPNCTHVFHVACVDTWFQTHSTCPLCRSHVCDITSYIERSFSIPMESLPREAFGRERTEHYQNLRSLVLQSSVLRHDGRDEVIR